MTLKGRVSPFGNPRIKACSQLPAAFRSVPRPSSPLGTKASTKCPSQALEPKTRLAQGQNPDAERHLSFPHAKDMLSPTRLHARNRRPGTTRPETPKRNCHQELLTTITPSAHGQNRPRDRTSTLLKVRLVKDLDPTKEPPQQTPEKPPSSPADQPCPKADDS